MQDDTSIKWHMQNTNSTLMYKVCCFLHGLGVIATATFSNTKNSALKTCKIKNHTIMQKCDQCI